MKTRTFRCFECGTQPCVLKDKEGVSFTPFICPYGVDVIDKPNWVEIKPKKKGGKK